MSLKNSFKTFNPLKNSFNESVYISDTITEIEKKVVLATEASKILSQKTYEDISNFLLEIKSQMISSKEQIKNTYLIETGLDQSRFEVEFKRTIYQLSHFSDFILSENWGNLNETVEHFSGKKLIKKKVGIGPILVLGASNFPLAYSTIGGDSVAALAAKCPVILKAHPYHTGTSMEVYKAICTAIDNCGFPYGTFTHVLDSGHENATFLAQHKEIKGIGFTGSQSGGEAIINLMKSRRDEIPVFAEMGSVNPVFILDLKESRINDVAKKLADSVCNDRGQFCTKPGVLFIPNNKIGNILSIELKNNIIQYKSGPMLHPSMRENFETKTSSIKNTMGDLMFFESEKKAEFHVSNKVVIISENEFNKIEIFRKEIFGPYTTIVMYENDPINNLDLFDGQLTCSIFSEKINEEIQKESIYHLAIQKAGRVVIDDVPTGVSVSKNMHHGGPYPASSDSRFTAVGSDSINRFLRDVTIQQNLN